MQRSGKIPHALGLGIINIKMAILSKDSCRYITISIKMPMTFFRSRSNNLKILELQKTLNWQGNLENKRIKLEESWFLTSDYTTKLH